MSDSYRRFRALLMCGLMSLTLLGGCASTGNPRDPLEPLNRGIYAFNDGFDNLLLKPAAEVYRGVLPQFVRTGVSNFFANINDVIVALNNLLQGKLLDAVSDVGRLVVNSTAGLLGVIDVATEIGLEKHNEDFGQTLGYWGIADGPYLVIPFLGPSNFRDAVGRFVDFKTDPITYVDPPSDRNILWGVRFINGRAELLDSSKILETAALDPYEFVRDAYLQRRRNLVYDGSPPPEKDDDTEIKIKPKTEQPGSAFPPSADGATPVGSVLVSGEAPTPAQLEAREKAAPAVSVQPASKDPRADAAPQTDSGRAQVVRVWTSGSSSY
jgi:phospholipid-binding lipoprotein MlaA